MEGIKNYGYNVIELLNSVITETDETFAQVIAEGGLFDLTNGNTDISNHLIHCNYDVDKLSNFLGNSNFNNILFKYNIGGKESSANLHISEIWYQDNDNHPNRFYDNAGVVIIGGSKIVMQLSLGVRYDIENQKYISDIEIRVPTV